MIRNMEILQISFQESKFGFLAFKSSFQHEFQIIPTDALGIGRLFTRLSPGYNNKTL